MNRSIFRETATIYRRGGMVEDDYGNLRPGTDTGQSYPALFEQRSSREVTMGGEVYTSDWAVYIVPEAGLDATDKIRRQDGSLFEVVGPPNCTQNAMGVAELVEAALRSISG